MTHLSRKVTRIRLDTLVLKVGIVSREHCHWKKLRISN